MQSIFISLWTFRRFILASIMSELKGRFARSRLGALWLVIQPLTQAAIFAIVLGQLLVGRIPGSNIAGAYPIYLLAGLSCWTIFAELMNRSVNMFFEFSNILKKISFPKICLPAILLGGALINNIILICSTAFIISFFGKFITIHWISLIPILIITVTMSLSIGLILGIINVFSRDISQAMTVLLQLWFWMTPVVYPISVVPDALRWILHLNPVTPLVGAFQAVILYESWPEISGLIYPVVLTVVLALFAFTLFTRASADVVDAL